MQNFVSIDYFDSQKPISGVYLITHTATGKIYVGSSRNLYSRRNQHMCELNNRCHYNKELQEAFNRSPFVTFSYFLTMDYINAEQRILNDYIGSGLLFNISADATAPWRNKEIPETAKEKMRVAALNREPNWEHLNNLHMSNVGRKRTDEQRQNISNSKIGKPMSEQHRQSIIQAHQKDCKAVIIDGVEHSSLKDAAEKYGVSYVTVRNRANNEAFPNWTWK